MVKRTALKVPLIGAHMSIAGGVDKAIERGCSIECTCIQIFTSYNNRWEQKLLKPDEIKSFKTLKKESTIKIVTAHNSYLHNLASPDPVLQEKSINGMIGEINRCSALEIPFVTMHPGSATDGIKQEGIYRISNALNRILKSTRESGVTICLETTAGGGNHLGAKFEELAQVLRNIVQPSRIGICMDTCHLFAAGYDFTTEKNYQHMFNLFDTIIGFSYLKAIHCNDSKRELGSKIDRHEHIGEGRIGLTPFGFFMNDIRLSNISKILETPKREDLKEDIINLKKLRSLIKNKNK